MSVAPDLLVPHNGRDYAGSHAWGPWSKPYGVVGRDGLWCERRCQCGNRDFAPAPFVDPQEAKP